MRKKAIESVTKLYLSGDISLDEVSAIDAAILFLSDHFRTDWPELESGKRTELSEEFIKKFGVMAFRTLSEE
jgi:hypothetical protein